MTKKFWVFYSIKLPVTVAFSDFLNTSLAEQRMLLLNLWTNVSMGARYGCKRRANEGMAFVRWGQKKDQYQFLQNCTRKLMRIPTVFIQHFSLLDFTHYNHHISRETERGCDPSLWFLTSSPPLFQYFTQALSELKCRARGHFPSAHHHGVFIC